MLLHSFWMTTNTMADTFLRQNHKRTAIPKQNKAQETKGVSEWLERWSLFVVHKSHSQFANQRNMTIFSLWFLFEVRLRSIKNSPDLVHLRSNYHKVVKYVIHFRCPRRQIPFIRNSLQDNHVVPVSDSKTFHSIGKLESNRFESYWFSDERLFYQFPQLNNFSGDFLQSLVNHNNISCKSEDNSQWFESLQFNSKINFIDSKTQRDRKIIAIFSSRYEKKTLYYILKLKFIIIF